MKTKKQHKSLGKAAVQLEQQAIRPEQSARIIGGNNPWVNEPPQTPTPPP